MPDAAPQPSPLAPLQAAIAAVVGLLDSERVPGVVIGGVAASLLARPRATRDVDLLLWLEEARWPAFLDAARRNGLEPRLPDAVEFARRSRVLLLRHAASGSDVDLAFGALPFEQDAITRGSRRPLGPVEVTLPRHEVLADMKAVAHRPRDVADLEGLLQAHPTLDRRWVRDRVREMAAALEAPELLADLDVLLARSPTP